MRLKLKIEEGGLNANRIYTNAFKYGVIEEAFSNKGMSDVEVAEQYGIKKSLVAKWKQS